MIHRLAIAFLLLTSAAAALAEGGFVMTLYHHVSDETPRSTSLSTDELESHIKWLKDHDFSIKALPEALQELQAGQYGKKDRIAVISFDDSYRSICENGFPLLKKHNVPFTLFITTDFVKNKLPGQCTVEQLKTMLDSGLMTIGNHTRSHPHMTDASAFANRDAWLTAMQEEITGAQAYLEQHFGKLPKYFAYPYGEYNQALQALVKSLGYIGFGQHSGAIGLYSDMTILPRFPLAGSFSDVETINDKLLSLALPASISQVTDSPVKASSRHNPPKLVLNLEQKLPNPVQCFLGSGKAVDLKQDGNKLRVKHDEPLDAGRQRYNCTAASGIDGRFYWFSYQWVID